MRLISRVQARMHSRAAAVAPAIAAALILMVTFVIIATTGTGGTRNLSVPGSGRYIRMDGTARATRYGYPPPEFRVFASASPRPAPAPAPRRSGAPPPSFWGDTGAIPPATHVLEVEVIDRTYGRFPASRVYWSFNGQEKSIAQQRYIDMPANSAGRMYFYLGSPHSQYYDFIEFTVGPSSINVDTTRVNRFGLKLALLLHGHDGSSQEVGENYATFRESRSATFHRFRKFVPAPFKELATDDAPFGIPSPGNDPAFQTGGRYANYYSRYAASVGDSTDSTRRSSAAPALSQAIPRSAPGSTGTSLSFRRRSRPIRPSSTRPARQTTTLNSGIRTLSTASRTDSPTTIMPGSPRTSRSQTRSTWSSPSAGKPAVQGEAQRLQFLQAELTTPGRGQDRGTAAVFPDGARGSSVAAGRRESLTGT